MATKNANNLIRLTSDYLRATSTVQFSSSAKMKVTYKDGTTWEGTFDAWKKDPAKRVKIFNLKTVTIGRKEKKVQAFVTPANDEEKSWLIDKIEGLERKFPVGNSQQVGRYDIVPFRKLFRGVFPKSTSFTLGLIDREETKDEEFTTNVPA